MERTIQMNFVKKICRLTHFLSNFDFFLFEHKGAQPNQTSLQ